MNTIINSIKELILRDLNKLKTEINSYKNESDIWNLDGEIKNTAGNLCLHLCGNLQHYIGANLGKTGYVRNRDLEFSAKGVSRENLLKESEAAIKAVEKGLSTIQDTDLEKTYPEEVLGKPMTTGFFLVHLAGHLNYHLGQVNYHRRLLGKN